jgi:PhzF family phenazine biosynthesis protein
MECFVVDAFTADPFRGNPAGVCFVDGEIDDDRMPIIAAELKHAETAFLEPRADGSFGLRWWTPETEVALCGHATLASAHVLFSTNRLAPDGTAVFHTLSGELRATHADDDRITLDFPVSVPEPSPPEPSLFEALGIEPAPLARTPFFAVVELPDAESVRKLSPNLHAIRRHDVDAVLVTAPSDDARFDVVDRVFGPRVGIPEDAATGSALCALLPYWASRFGDELRVAQVSPRGAELDGRRDGDRVFISGHAVTVMRGELVA